MSVKIKSNKICQNMIQAFQFLAEGVGKGSDYRRGLVFIDEKTQEFYFRRQEFHQSSGDAFIKCKETQHIKHFSYFTEQKIKLLTESDAALFDAQLIKTKAAFQNAYKATWFFQVFERLKLENQILRLDTLSLSAQEHRIESKLKAQHKEIVELQKKFKKVQSQFSKSAIQSFRLSQGMINDFKWLSSKVKGENHSEDLIIFPAMNKKNSFFGQDTPDLQNFVPLIQKNISEITSWNHADDLLEQIEKTKSAYESVLSKASYLHVLKRMHLKNQIDHLTTLFTSAEGRMLELMKTRVNDLTKHGRNKKVSSQLKLLTQYGKLTRLKQKQPIPA